METLYNKYYTWYLALCQDRQILGRKKGSSEYFENHHIIPTSLGGINKKDNRVLLTAKEHYIAHHLLVKFTIGKDNAKMWAALGQFFIDTKNAENRKNLRLSARLYQVYKETYAKIVSNRMKGNKHTLGRHLSDKHKSAISAVLKGRKLSQAHKDKISQANKGQVVVISKATKNKMSISHTGSKMADKTIEKLRQINLANPTRGMLGKHQSTFQKQRASESNKGKIVSEETRLKLRLANIAYRQRQLQLT